MILKTSKMSCTIFFSYLFFRDIFSPDGNIAISVSQGKHFTQTFVENSTLMNLVVFLSPSPPRTTDLTMLVTKLMSFIPSLALAIERLTRLMKYLLCQPKLCICVFATYLNNTFFCLSVSLINFCIFFSKKGNIFSSLNHRPK